MNFKQLEYFVCVAEFGSLTRAAASLNMSPASLSRQIKLLEEDVHEDLMSRNGRGLMLTSSGKRLLEHAYAILGSSERALAELRNMRGEATGHIAIGIPPRVSSAILPPLIKEFCNRFPRASISITEGLSSTLHDSLILGRIELALLYDPPVRPSLDLALVFQEELVLVGPRRARNDMPASVRFEDLPRYPLIMPKMPNATRALVESTCAVRKTKLKISIEVDTVHTIFDLIRHDLGYGVLPQGVPARYSLQSDYAISRIRLPAVINKLFLATALQRPQTLLARETHKLLLSLNFPQLLG